MDVRLPNGDIVKNVPDGTSDEHLLGKLQLARHPGAESLMQALVQKSIAKDVSGMSTGEKFWAAAGKAPSDLYQGAKQAIGMGNQAEIDESKRRDAPLMATGAGKLGNMAGTALTLAPAAMVPGMQGYVGAGVVGAAAGASQPVASDEQGLYGMNPRLMNTGFGAASGLAGQFAGNMIGRAITPATSRLGPEEQQLAQRAMQEGIPLTAGQRTGSRPLQTAESVMENLPLTARPQGAIREGQQRAFTQSVLKRTGMSQDVADAGSMLAQKQNLGGEMGSIAERNSLDFAGGLKDRLGSIVGDAQTHLPPDEAARVASTVKQILSGAPAGKPEQTIASKILSESGEPFKTIVPATSAKPMAGTLYQGWRQPLRDLADNTAAGRYYGQIRKALDSEFAGQLQGADAGAYQQASRQYANLKTVIDAMGGPGNLPAKGQVAPAQLSAALARSIGKENKALGGGDLNELSRIGQLFVRDQIPNSGTAQRALMQNLITGGGGATAGGFYGAMANPNDPLKGAAAGAAGGAALGMGATLAGPRAIQAIMNSGAGQSYLANQMLSPAQRAAITAAMRSTAIGAAPMLEAQQ